MSVSSVGPDVNGGDRRSDRLRRWSVVIVATGLAVVSAAGTVGSTDSATAHVVVPLAASAAIVGAGGWLQRTDLTGDDVAVVATWIVTTAVLFGAVALVAAFVLADEPLAVGGYVATFVAPLGASGGAVAGYYDARRRQQHRVTRRTQRALETASDGIAILNDSDEFVTVNQSHASVYGYDDPAELIGESWRTCYTDEALARIEREVRPGLADRGEWRGEVTGKRADGSTFLQALTLTRMDDGGVVCVVRDVTAEHEQSRQLREQKRRLELIVENAPIALYAFEPDGTMTLSEGRGLEALGIEPGEIVGESVFELYAETPEVVESCRRAAAGEQTHHVAEIGDVVFEFWMTPVVEGGTVTQVIGTAIDVTDEHERKRQIAALHEASRQLTYATTLEAVAETAVDILDEILDRTLTALWRYDDERERLEPVRVNEAMRTLAAEADVTIGPLGDGTVAMECYRDQEISVIDDYGRVGGAAFPQLTLGTVILVPIGDHGLLQVGHQAVTGLGEAERTQLEILQLNLQAALDRADRERLLRKRSAELELRTSQMEFINSILRHDILNGMTVIRARAEFLESDLEGRHGEYADTIVRWCDDINDFVERVQIVLNALSGSDAIGVKPVEATERLADELERLRQTYSEISFEAALPAESWVQANDLLSDVLGNLVRNAVEHNDPDDLEVSVSVEAGAETTTVRVADNGRGIPPAERERVFRRGETHAKSAGSGFGLFFVDAMVDAYGGEIHIEDNDPGAVFVLELPTAPPAEGPKE